MPRLFHTENLLMTLDHLGVKQEDGDCVFVFNDVVQTPDGVHMSLEATRRVVVSMDVSLPQVSKEPQQMLDWTRGIMEQLIVKAKAQLGVKE